MKKQVAFFQTLAVSSAVLVGLCALGFHAGHKLSLRQVPSRGMSHEVLPEKLPALVPTGDSRQSREPEVLVQRQRGDISILVVYESVPCQAAARVAWLVDDSSVSYDALVAHGAELSDSSVTSPPSEEHRHLVVSFHGGIFGPFSVDRLSDIQRIDLHECCQVSFASMLNTEKVPCVATLVASDSPQAPRVVLDALQAPVIHIPRGHPSVHACLHSAEFEFDRTSVCLTSGTRGSNQMPLGVCVDAADESFTVNFVRIQVPVHFEELVSGQAVTGEGFCEVERSTAGSRWSRSSRHRFECDRAGAATIAAANMGSVPPDVAFRTTFRIAGFDDYVVRGTPAEITVGSTIRLERKSQRRVRLITKRGEPFRAFVTLVPLDGHGFLWNGFPDEDGRVGPWHWDGLGCFVEMNSSTTDIFGVAQREVIGQISASLLSQPGTADVVVEPPVGAIEITGCPVDPPTLYAVDEYGGTYNMTVKVPGVLSSGRIPAGRYTIESIAEATVYSQGLLRRNTLQTEAFIRSAGEKVSLTWSEDWEGGSSVAKWAVSGTDAVTNDSFLVPVFLEGAVHLDLSNEAPGLQGCGELVLDSGEPLPRLVVACTPLHPVVGASDVKYGQRLAAIAAVAEGSRARVEVANVSFEWASLADTRPDSCRVRLYLTMNERLLKSGVHSVKNMPPAADLTWVTSSRLDWKCPVGSTVVAEFAVEGRMWVETLSIQNDDAKAVLVSTPE